MNLWRYSLRETQRRPGRTLLTLLGIVLGIATIVATRLTVYTTRAAYGEMFQQAGGASVLEITAPGQGGFQGDFAPSLTFLPGVHSAVPRAVGVVALVKGEQRVPISVVGVDDDPGAANAQVSSGGQQDSDRFEPCWLDADTAQRLGLSPGDAIHLWALSGPAQLRMQGYAPPSDRPTGPGGILRVSRACAQRLFQLGHMVNHVEITLDEAADIDQVKKAIADKLPPGLTVQLAGRRSDLARATLLATEQGLHALSMIALVSAVFVMLNTLLLNLGERRRSLALLRVLGTTEAQLRGLLLREMLCLGLVGTAGGCGLGIVLGWSLLAAMAQFLGIDMPRMHYFAEPFLLAGTLGPGIALLVALVPSWLASRRPPLPTLNGACHGRSHCSPCGCSLVGAVLLAAGVILAVGLIAAWIPLAAGQILLAPAIALILVGSVLFLPLFSVPLWGLAARLPLGLEGKLALQQLIRQPLRSHLTAGIMFLALATAIAFSHLILGILDDLEHWYGHTIVADYLVRSSMPDTAAILPTAMPEKVGDEIRQSLPGAAVDKLSFVPGEANGQTVLVLARTFGNDLPLPLDLEEGAPDEVLSGLHQGQVVLGSGLARQLGLHTGDSVVLTTAEGPKRLVVAGLAREYLGMGSCLYLEWEQCRRLLENSGVHAFLVKTGNGSSAEARGKDLEAFCKDHELFLQSNAELRVLIEMLLSHVTGALWALLALSFVLSGLGIVNTLTMNVQDQARQFGLLRALGLRCRQVRTLVLWQAGLLTWLSAIPGGLTGIGLAWLINRASASWGGPAAPFQLRIGVVIGCGVLSLGLALFAALVPACRAARLPLKELL